MDLIRYDPSVETIRTGEQETLAELSRIFRGVQENVLHKKGQARRATHAKATAFLKGELVIPDDLPPELGQSLFARRGRYENRGAERAAAVGTLLATAKLNDVDPQAWLTGILARIADDPAHRLHELLPWR